MKEKGFAFIQPERKLKSAALSNKIFVFTGELEKFSRAQAEEPDHPRESADDQAGDEGDPDNEGHSISREAGRH